MWSECEWAFCVKQNAGEGKEKKVWACSKMFNLKFILSTIERYFIVCPFWHFRLSFLVILNRMMAQLLFVYNLHNVLGPSSIELYQIYANFELHC